MFCKKCGAPLPEGTKFCTACGAPVEEEPIVEAAPVEEAAPVYEATPVYNAVPVAPAANSTPILVWGIVAIALSTSGILGLIFSIIAKNKAKAFENAYGPLTGKAKVGKILATVALIVSIVMIVFWVIYAVIFGIALAAEFM